MSNIQVELENRKWLVVKIVDHYRTDVSEIEDRIGTASQQIRFATTDMERYAADLRDAIFDVMQAETLDDAKEVVRDFCGDVSKQ